MRQRPAQPHAARSPATRRRPHARALAAHSATVLTRHPALLSGELPSGLERLSFVWERGHKVFATNAERVNPHTRAVFWSQHLRQVLPAHGRAGATHRGW